MRLDESVVLSCIIQTQSDFFGNQLCSYFSAGLCDFVYMYDYFAGGQDR